MISPSSSKRSTTVWPTSGPIPSMQTIIGITTPDRSAPSTTRCWAAPLGTMNGRISTIRFTEQYFARAEHVELAPDARAAIGLVADLGWSQSLLSMSHQDWLDGIVDRFDLRRHLDLVTGLSGATGGLKAVHLTQHLLAMGVDGDVVVMIGDTPDDVAAARHVGAESRVCITGEVIISSCSSVRVSRWRSLSSRLWSWRPASRPSTAAGLGVARDRGRRPCNGPSRSYCA